MSISHQLHQFLVSREYGGGAEIALQLATFARIASGQETHVWAPGEGRACERVRERGLPIHFYDGRGIFSRSRIRAGAANLATGMSLRRLGGGLIHIHSPHNYAALRHGFRLAGVKTVLHIHLDFDVDSLRWTLKQPPDLIVTCARFLVDRVRDALPQSLASQQNIAAVPNAVDFERFKPADKTAAKLRLGASLDRPLLLMMANLAPHKGQETAIRALAQLRGRGIDAQLWMAGADRSQDMSYEPVLQKLISELDLGNRISLLGFRTDGPDLLQAADVLLLPSTSEGLPLTLLEAQASGTPVIAAPTAGIPEIVKDGETGFLVGADDAIGYAAKIELLIQRPELSRRIVEQASVHCRAEHDWETYRRRMFELYSHVMKN